ncbi:MAG: argininosuccinate lyase [Terriglobia bacterium]
MTISVSHPPPDPSPDQSRFPAPIYAETVLGPNFRITQRLFLNALLELHYAHTLMLAKQGIVSAGIARRCLEGLDKLDRAALSTVEYDGETEDLFFHIEARLAEAAGVENTGYMHLARSRNDIAITLYRMRLREEILGLSTELTAVRAALLVLAREHIATLMPAYTHTQPAQPITFAHYLLAVIEIMGRDVRRLQAAWRTVNCSPLGACAIATTGFPIDRYYTAGLLGFEELQLNSYGAIAATDYLTETAGAISVAMINLGRVAQDFLLWCTAEFGFLRLSGAWVQISSIMPQKRNPVAFEHVRMIGSKALAQAGGVLTVLHNTPFGDINDAEDGLMPLVFGATHDAGRALRLFRGIMSEGCEVRTDRMAARAHADFLTVTELADTLVRRESVSFHDAHGLVSAAVSALQGDYSPEATVDAVCALAPQFFGRDLRTARAELVLALDPAHFVAIRGIPGGPAREAVEPALAAAAEDVDQARLWITEKTRVLAAYPVKIRAAVEALNRLA